MGKGHAMRWQCMRLRDKTRGEAQRGERCGMEKHMAQRGVAEPSPDRVAHTALAGRLGNGRSRDAVWSVAAESNDHSCHVVE